MTFKVKILAAVLTVFVIYYAFFYEPVYSGQIENWNETLVVAHRGFGNLAPDNSLTGVRLALENKLDGVDVDGYLTKDGKIVIFHDISVDRLTNGTGKVSDMTLEELKSLDLGPKFNESFRGSFVASFEDFLVAVNGSAIYMVELKATSIKDTGIEKEAIDIIRKHDAQNWTYLSSFNPAVINRIEETDPSIITVFAFMDTNWNEKLLAEIPEKDRVDLPWIVRQEYMRKLMRKVAQPDILSINMEVDEKTTNSLIEKGWPVFIWDPDTQEDIKSALSKKPYGIISNEPLLAKRLRDEK